MRKGSWDNVPGTFAVEIITDNGTVCDIDGNPLPILNKFVSAGQNDLELIIDFTSSGHYEPKSMYGGSDRLGWPESGSDERYLSSAYLTPDYRNKTATIELPPEVQDKLFDYYYNKIQEADLKYDDSYGDSYNESRFSRNLDKALSTLQENDQINSDIDFLIKIATSDYNYKDRKHFTNSMSEGAILNVNKLVSAYIGVPVGKYIVYDINSKTAMIIPTSDHVVETNDFNTKPSHYEIYTKDLLNCWNKTEIISEDDMNDLKKINQQGNKERIQKAKHKYPRNEQIKGAIESSGRSQEELADECGVDPSTISRWTAASGEGARKPSLDAALDFANSTGLDVESMFGSTPDTRAKKHKTSGSGGGRNTTYTQGSKE